MKLICEVNESIEILTALYVENNITDTNSIEKDVDHII